jgi:hypothetical protein
MNIRALLIASLVIAATPRTFADPAPGLGDFGSSEPIERADLPTRGVITLKIEDRDKVLQQGPHWEQYNFPFKSRRWGKYAVRMTYTLRAATLGVQVKFGESQLKRSITRTNGGPKQAWFGEIYIPAAGDQFIAVFTPQGMSEGNFNLMSLDLVPAPEGDEVKQAEDGSVVLEPKSATTWSENMRYEPKPEKNCLGFWTDEKDFAEWEVKLDKPGRFKVTVHQGSKPGGSKIALELGTQKLSFTAKDTGDIHKAEPVEVGEVKIDKPGTYRLALKPQSKSGGAIMDLKKIVLTPAS